jgi:hypothetical protein
MIRASPINQVKLCSHWVEETEFVKFLRKWINERLSTELN